jgi:hypothetical protein
MVASFFILLMKIELPHNGRLSQISSRSRQAGRPPPHTHGVRTILSDRPTDQPPTAPHTSLTRITTLLLLFAVLVLHSLSTRYGS